MIRLEPTQHLAERVPNPTLPDGAPSENASAYATPSAPYRHVTSAPTSFAQALQPATNARPSPAARYAAALRDSLISRDVPLDAPGVRVVVLGESGRDSHTHAVRAALDGETGVLRGADVRMVNGDWTDGNGPISDLLSEISPELFELTDRLRRSELDAAGFRDLIVAQYIFSLASEQANMERVLASTPPDGPLQLVTMSTVSPSWAEVTDTIARAVIGAYGLSEASYGYTYEKLMTVREEARSSANGKSRIQRALLDYESTVQRGIEANTVFVRSVSNGHLEAVHYGDADAARPPRVDSLLTVGASDPGVLDDPCDDAVASFSTRARCVAPGIGHPYRDGNLTDGSSFSTPFLCGELALVASYGGLDARGLYALLAEPSVYRDLAGERDGRGQFDVLEALEAVCR